MSGNTNPNEIEKIVLSLMIEYQPEYFELGLEMFKGEDFQDDHPRRIFEAMSEISNTNGTVSLQSLTVKLRGQVLAAIITEIVGSYLDIKGQKLIWWFEQLRDRNAKLKLGKLAERLTQIVQDPKSSYKKAIAETDLVLMNISGAQVVNEPELATDVFTKFYQRVNRIIATGATPGIKTGYHEIDRMTGGLEPGTMVIIAGQTSMGKTSFFTNVLVNLAKRGIGSLIFSLEMSKDSLMNRIVSMETGIDGLRLKNGNISEEEKQLLVNAGNTITDWPLYIDDTPILNVQQIRRKSKRMIAKDNRIKIIAVDYLQQVDLPKAENKNLATAEATRTLRAAAKEMKVPMLLICQLNRGMTRNKDKRPSMSDLRDSGAIEQDADGVIFIYRDIVYNTKANPDEAEAIVAKWREGRTGTASLQWQCRTTTFKNWVKTETWTE